MFAVGYLSGALFATTALLVACGAVRMRGTTLAAPALWALASLLALAVVEMMVAGGGAQGGPSPLRYAVAVTTLCPVMAVLGAKRPQDRAWQWVVLALLVTLWLPAARGMLLERSTSLDLFLAWQIFLAVLVLLGPLNYLPTRNWGAALLAIVGQSALLLPYLAPVGADLQKWAAPVAGMCFLAAAANVWLRIGWRQRSKRRAAMSSSEKVTELDAYGSPSQADDCTERSALEKLAELSASWLRFRDAFGAFWAVRVMQRIDQGLPVAAPSVVLTWQGWHVTPVSEGTSHQELEASVAHAKRSLRTALRRFVRRESA